MQLTQHLLLVAALVATAHPGWAQQTNAAAGSTQRVQGTIHVDAGKGMVELTSRATTLPDNLGAQAASRLQTSEGKAALQQGNARDKAVTGQEVSANDVQAIANQYAGKTVYESSMRLVPVLKRYLLVLDAKASMGPRVALSVELNEKTYEKQGANITYYPDSSDFTNDFRSGKNLPVAVQIDKIERVGDKVYAVSGSFSARDLQPGALSKKLKGQVLPAVQGRFVFAEVPVR